MNVERPAKTNRRFAKFVARHVTETLTRGGAEMISVPRQGLLAVGNRAGKVAAHEPHGGAFIPAFGELGFKLDNPRKQTFGFAQFLLLHSFDTGAEDPVNLGVSRATPRAPEQSFGSCRELWIIALQRLERFAIFGRVDDSVVNHSGQLRFNKFCGSVTLISDQ